MVDVKFEEAPLKSVRELRTGWEVTTLHRSIRQSLLVYPK
jgi:hypothetical protein